MARPMILMILLIALLSATMTAANNQCRPGPVQVYGTGPIALVSLMNAWGQKYSEFRNAHRYSVRVLYNDSSSHRAIPSSNKPVVWFTVSHTRQIASPDQFYFPYLVRALVVIFNLEGAVTNLNITVRTLADIYSGNVTIWNDPRVQKYNPGVDIPSHPIQRVARMEDAETTTGLFTQFLGGVSEEWEEKYGSFFGPEFVNKTCCNSTKWPPGVIKYFARDVVGMVGILSSFANTIGYITMPSIAESNTKSLTMATLLNNDGTQMIQPTVAAQQQVMKNYFQSLPENSTDNNTMLFTRDLLFANGAYPMTSVTYMTLNTSFDVPDTDCCIVMELIGFIDWILDEKTAGFQLNQSYVPILPELASRIRDRMLKNVACNGRYMYEEYLQSLQPEVPPVEQTWLMAFLAVGGVFLLITVVYAYLYNQRRKRADVSQWLIPNSRIRFDTANTQKGHKPKLSRHSSAHSSFLRHLPGQKIEDKFAGIQNDTGSIHTDPSDEKIQSRQSPAPNGSFGDAHGGAAIEQLKDLCPTGELDGNLVSLIKLNLVRSPPINWPSRTKRLMTDLKSCSVHKNLATILGVVCTVDGRQFLVAEHCSKGTLHYVLSTCRYRLTDAIRRFLCLDVARAFVYLHDRNLASGRLSSITCYLDSSWTVKVAEWQTAALHFEEAVTGRGYQLQSLLGVAYRQDELLDEEKMIRLLYLDAAIPEPRNLLDDGQSSKAEGMLVTALKHADEYSFGYLLVEIFSGRLPYTTEAEMEDFSYADFFKEKFQGGGSSRLPVMPQHCPKVVAQLIEQCLKPEPKMRPRFARIYKLLNEMNVGGNAKRIGGAGTGKGIVDVMMEAMDTYAHTLEEKVEERTTELKMLTKRMRDLLNEVLPPVVAEKLFTGQTVLPEFFECVSVYFSDIVGFTTISAQSTPFQVMSLLNDLWLLFDSVIDKFDVYKVDTIGDAYMVCSGLPNRNGMLHCKNICQLSLALLERCGQFKIPHLPTHQLRIRIGVNSGPVTAGVVGSKMPQYCVFGDTVNTAARMESTSVPNKIQITHNTHELLKTHFPADFLTQYRGQIDVKGKGTMETYWLMGHRDSQIRRSISE